MSLYPGASWFDIGIQADCVCPPTKALCPAAWIKSNTSYWPGQVRLFINEVFLHEGNFTGNGQYIHYWRESGNYWCIVTMASPRDNELISFWLLSQFPRERSQPMNKRYKCDMRWYLETAAMACFKKTQIPLKSWQLGDIGQWGIITKTIMTGLSRFIASGRWMWKRQGS